jgi:hypothetical protein
MSLHVQNCALVRCCSRGCTADGVGGDRRSLAVMSAVESSVFEVHQAEHLSMTSVISGFASVVTKAGSFPVLDLSWTAPIGTCRCKCQR